MVQLFAFDSVPYKQKLQQKRTKLKAKCSKFRRILSSELLNSQMPFQINEFHKISSNNQGLRLPNELNDLWNMVAHW